MKQRHLGRNWCRSERQSRSSSMHSIFVLANRYVLMTWLLCCLGCSLSRRYTVYWRSFFLWRLSTGLIAMATRSRFTWRIGGLWSRWSKISKSVSLRSLKIKNSRCPSQKASLRIRFQAPSHLFKRSNVSRRWSSSKLQIDAATYPNKSPNEWKIVCIYLSRNLIF
jgi:hypothetical protein